MTLIHQPVQPKFGAWQQADAAAKLRDQVEQLERTLETDLSHASGAQSAGDTVTFSTEIQELKDTLKKVTDNNGYGMDAAIDTLRTLQATGYKPTAEETEKIKLLVKKSSHNLFEHIQYFPKTGYHDYPSSRRSAEDLELLLPHWVNAQTDYRQLVKLVKIIDQSTEFVGDTKVQRAIADKLQALQETLENPEQHQAYLKQMGNTFRPKAAMESDLRKVVEFLFPTEGTLFEGNLDADIHQAVGLIAKRSQKINYAGRTADGQLYVITSSIEPSNYEQNFYMGTPGNLKKLECKDGVRARNGSHDLYVMTDGTQFEFHRGGMFNADDKSLWKASVKGIPVAQEFPTDELSTEK